METKVDIEQLLRDGQSIQMTVNGYSMYPMLTPNRDMVILSPLPARPLRRGDVVLYRRENSILVLHRVHRAASEGLYMVGDNQTKIEGPLAYSQARGILTAFVRKGKTISVHQPSYRVVSRIWLVMRPFRHSIAVLVHKIKVIFRCV